MRKAYRLYCPEQQFLLPPSVQNWLPENHFVSSVSEYEQEDRLYGKKARGDELSEELKPAGERLKRIRRLGQRARLEAKAAGKDDETAKPEDKDQYNFTDPESRIVKGPDGFVQAYKAQLAVDEKTQLIVAQRVTDQGNDKERLVPILEAVTVSMGKAPHQIVTDNGHCLEKNLEYLEEKTIDGCIATGKVKHGRVPAPSTRGRLPKRSSAVDRMRRKLATKRGRRILARRKSTLEPTIGQIEHQQGFRQFLIQGMEKVGTEWALAC